MCHAAYVRPGEDFGSGQHPSFASIWKTSLAHKSEDPERYAITGWQQDPQQKWGSLMKKREKLRQQHIELPSQIQMFLEVQQLLSQQQSSPSAESLSSPFLCTPAHQALTQDKHCYVV